MEQPELILRLNFLCLLIAVPKPDNFEFDEAGVLVGEDKLERTDTSFRT